MSRDHDMMQRALDLARLAAEAGEVPVGAVVCDSETGTVLGEGRNQPIATHDPTAHAEIAAIRAACEAAGNYRLTGATLYVTLEPCAMCAGAISFARIGRLVFAAADEKGGAVLNGPRFFEQPTCHWRPEIVQDETSAPEAATLLREFFRARRLT
ncbi:nucleoside deaminase [Henriciella mobilis]|uniref:tRNA-specific adenosine deaminase n=1 Tax=Henriciella mobilis TaxID=2305467 RepID=A0A399RSW8_9PROT|nr:nucleoside deaminase [Henriciella mobilis]RIJ16246.1 nucleoside deaminase [Henriciella mobilis]RIJ23167.1 nucleoside deaminase [Henriciella mobilis]RIJ33149.1 nucleoside deaminase [Henriciella mobilis]